ncbi:hypothetical protein EFN20_04905 [Propionibacterium freudenreichii]|nr:hypothetical protein [Propionibacterium freudenreichii]MCT3007029.1 hypothetical protein [Propionibacterium freudenreichii]MCT3009208.1 hypothetical protein [Propionibacterium freudenreichii]
MVNGGGSWVGEEHEGDALDHLHVSAQAVARGYVNSIRPRDDGPTWPQLTRDQQHRAFRGCPLRGWCP